MKTSLKLFSAGALAFILLNGCASESIVNSTPIIEAITAEANSVALRLAVNDPAERLEIANYEFAAATAARSLSGGTVLTPDNFRTYIGSFFPKVAIYGELASVITAIYANYFPQIQGDPKLALQVLEAIARGVESSAKNIIDAERGFSRISTYDDHVSQIE